MVQHSAKYKKESSNYFEAIFNYATTSIVIVDFSGNIIAVNPFALQEFGYTTNELTGRPIDLLIPQRFREQHALYHVQYFKEPQSRLMHSGRDLFAIKKDGTEFSVEISLS